MSITKILLFLLLVNDTNQTSEDEEEIEDIEDYDDYSGLTKENIEENDVEVIPGVKNDHVLLVLDKTWIQPEPSQAKLRWP
jgi:hypothetical protein